MDAALWLNFYGFDIMGDLAFGRSFNMLVDGVKHRQMTLMENNTTIGSTLGCFSWAFTVLQRIPLANSVFDNFYKWLRQEVTYRMDMR